MKKYLILIIIVILIASCTRDSNIKRITISFNMFIDSLEIENTADLEMNMPFLPSMTKEEQISILKPFRDLGNIKYDLEVIKNSESIYYLQIITKNSESIWKGLFIPYEQNIDGKWVMAPVIKSVQTFDIIPAQN